MLYIGLSGPHTVFEDLQEVEPWGRITATRTQSHRELSTNGRFLEANRRMEDKGWGPGAVSRQSPAARTPPPPGSPGQRPSLLHVAVPSSFWPVAEVTPPTTSMAKELRPQRPSSLVASPDGR